MEESMLRDRIVVGIRDDVTRRKLLQMRDLTLNQAIDMCKTSETAGQQLKEMATPEEVQLLKSGKQPQRRRGRGGPSNSNNYVVASAVSARTVAIAAPSDRVATADAT